MQYFLPLGHWVAALQARLITLLTRGQGLGFFDGRPDRAGVPAVAVARAAPTHL